MAGDEAGALRPMLEAGSVAVVGASPRPGSVGEQMMAQLVGGGFEGPIYPVNPKYESVLDHPCYPALDRLPEPVDLVLLGVANERLEEQLRSAARAGAGAAVIFASCHEEPRPGLPSLVERLTGIAREAGLVICGGNCMGFVNLERNLRALAFEEREDLRPGPIALVSHSGSVFSALLHNDRGLRFNLAVSAGQEFTTTVADYMRYALDLPTTRALALFIETVRDPGGFRDALDRAARLDVPVVAIKVGREAATKDLIEAHSGALAGEDGAFEAVFEAHGVLRVHTLDEMADAVELVVSGRRAAPGGLAAIHDSGGERAHLIDVAAEVGVPFAEISETTRDRLAAVLEPGLPAVNPLDAWGTGKGFESIYLDCIRILLRDPATAAFAFVVDLAGEDLEEGYTEVATQVFAETEKPMAILSNLSSAVDRRAARELRSAGIPVLEGTATGLTAFRRLLEYRDVRALPPVRPAAPVDPGVRDRWRDRLGTGEPLPEAAALELLRDYGISVVEAVPASTLDGALAAAERLGWPVGLKTAAPGVTHKTERRGVRLGIGNADELGLAYRDIERRLGPDLLVVAMAPPGVELALGVVRDEQFGPLVLVAAGGVLVEVLGDRRLGLPPVDAARARRLIDGLGVRPLLDGVRGDEPADLDAVCGAVARLSLLASDLGDLIRALDVNPLIAGPGGCVAVDALVVPVRSRPASR